MIAITITILFGTTVIFVLFIFLGSQVSQFKEMLPQFMEKSTKVVTDLQKWLKTSMGVSIQYQAKMLEDGQNEAKNYLGDMVGSFFNAFSVIILIPVYVFLILLYKKLFKNFLFEVFENEDSVKVATIQNEIQDSIQKYLLGLIIEMAIIAVLNSAVLLILGIQNAILLGVIGAMLNIIPYLGGVIAILLPVIVAFVTKDGYSTPLLVIGAYTVIQLIDNNYIVPKVVSSKVSVNAIVSILVVILGGSLWGISGMFLSIPFVAIIKIIFDNVDGLKPWGKILGDNEK